MPTLLDFFEWSNVPPHFIKCILCKYVKRCKLRKQKNHMNFHLRKSHNNIFKDIEEQHVCFFI